MNIRKKVTKYIKVFEKATTIIYNKKIPNMIYQLTQNVIKITPRENTFGN